MENKNQFKLSYNLAMITAERLGEQNKEIYKINFSNEVPPVIIERITATGNDDFIWDTIPAGNIELAAGLGKLIEEYLQQKNG